MEFLEWSSEYETGIAEIDSQHQELVALGNRFFAQIQETKSRLVIDEALDGLIEYVQTHFDREEELMKSTGYQGFDAHRLEHRELTTRVYEIYQGKYDGDALTEIAVLFKEWLQRHILETDSAFGRFLRKT